MRHWIISKPLKLNVKSSNLNARDENARDLIAKSQAFISNLVRFTGHQMRQVYHRQIPSQTPLDRPDCIRKGLVAVSLSVEKAAKPSTLGVGTRGKTGLINRHKSCKPAQGLGLRPFTHAVWNQRCFYLFDRSQTRLDGFQMKNQLCSPQGQKSGIGIAAVSPVPVRETDEEKEISTRAYGSDEGKAVAMEITKVMI